MRCKSPVNGPHTAGSKSGVAALRRPVARPPAATTSRPAGDRQSIETDQDKRKALVWEVERRLAEDGARPIIFYDRRATCWQPQVKGLTIMVNNISNGGRMEYVWLDK